MLPYTVETFYVYFAIKIDREKEREKRMRHTSVEELRAFEGEKERTFLLPRVINGYFCGDVLVDTVV